jgi:hypothetical protein
MYILQGLLGLSDPYLRYAIGNMLAMPVEDPASNNILRTALEVCNTDGHQKKKLKLHLIVYLCSTFRKFSINSIGLRPAMDAGSVLRRMCTAQRQRAMTLVSNRAMVPGQAMLLGRASLVQHTTMMTLTWASTLTQW